jgi:hypothetical protein
MMITPASKLVLKYLALPLGLGGRGGVLRFFLLTQDIPFTEELIQMGDDWVAEKARLVSSGENPSATVPVIMATANEEEIDDDDDKKKLPAASATILPQHIATARLLARVHGSTSGDMYKDYVQDLVADEYQGFRDRWVAASFSSTDEEKASYRRDELPKQLTKFDALYEKFKTHHAFLSVSSKTNRPLWGDAAIFGLLRDHIITGHTTLDDLTFSYPHLSTMYESYENIPSVAKWIKAVDIPAATS